MKKRLFILGALLLTATAGYSLWTANSEANKWNSLSAKREKSMVTRHLGSFEAFLNRQMGTNMVTVYGRRMSGLKENVVYAYGRIIKDSKNVGMISPRYYYHGWAEEPTSVDYNLVLNPSLVKSLGQTEFNRLILQTRKDQPVTSKIGDISWFSQIDENGNVKVNLHAPYPTKWVEDIPEYDRGYTDTFCFEDLDRALRYVRQNVLADEHALIWMNLPISNPPEHKTRYQIGRGTGYIQLPSGNLVSLEVATLSTTKWPHSRSFSITLGREGATTSSADEIKGILAPQMLAKGPRKGEDETFIDTMGDGPVPLHIGGPFDALDKYRPKR